MIRHLACGLGLDHTLEDELLGGRGLVLHVRDLRGRDQHLADQVLAAHQLHDQGHLVLRTQMPVVVVVVEQQGVRCTSAQDAVGVGLQPLPESFEGDGPGRGRVG